MPDFFSVQMNMPDTANVQVEQPASSSIDTSSNNTENSFNSILQKSLPKGDTTTDANLITQETTLATASSLNPSEGSDLKENILQLLAYLLNTTQTTANTTPENTTLTPKTTVEVTDETHLHLVNNDLIDVFNNILSLVPSENELETLQDIHTTLTQIYFPTETSAQTDLPLTTTTNLTQQNDLTLGTLKKTFEELQNLPINKIEHDGIVPSQTPTYLATNPDQQNKLSFSAFTKTIEELQNLLINKNTNDGVAAFQNPANLATNPSLQDEFSFGAFTKNLRELQNLLISKNGNDAIATSPTPVNISSQQQALLERIQSFISSGQEAGTLSIKNTQLPDQVASLRNPLTQFSTHIQMISGGSNLDDTSSLIKSSKFTTLEEGLLAPALGSQKQQLTGVRHDSTQQFYDAKTQPLNVLNENTNLADNQKGETMNQPGSGFNQMTSINTSSENSGIFSMTNTNSITPLTEQITDPTKATMLPSGTVVQDHEVIQQLVERFQVNRRQQDTKLQLKLHPVELGKMEIDLTVKEGSIRANVVAQSQHVQEILERNIAKLRSVLEQQGFNVEDITVTSSTETTSEFNLFEQHLSNGESSKFLNKNDNSENHTPFVVDEFQESLTETSTGVNVQA